MPQKSVSKQKGGVPLDKLLTVHTADDPKLASLLKRYGRDVVPASKIVAAPSTIRKPAKASAGNTSKRVAARTGGVQAIEVSSPRLIGYARVSTDVQTTALQLDGLRSVGCAVIHEDSVSSASRSRPGFKRAIDELEAGDTLVVWKLDRLVCSLTGLLEWSNHYASVVLPSDR